MADLQAKKGIDKILLFRLLKDEKSSTATKLAFQTEHSVEVSRDSDSQKTKDGTIQTLGAIEYDFSATCILAKGDEMAAKLNEALFNGDIVEIWEVDKAEKGTGDNVDKYKATYYQGYVSKYSETANSEDRIELELEFAINGIGQKGYVTLTEEQAKVVQYKFKDLSIGA